MKIKPLAPNEIEETIRRFTFQASPNSRSAREKLLTPGLIFSGPY